MNISIHLYLSCSKAVRYSVWVRESGRHLLHIIRSSFAHILSTVKFLWVSNFVLLSISADSLTSQLFQVVTYVLLECDYQSCMWGRLIGLESAITITSDPSGTNLQLSITSLQHSSIRTSSRSSWCSCGQIATGMCLGGWTLSSFRLSSRTNHGRVPKIGHVMEFSFDRTDSESVNIDVQIISSTDLLCSEHVGQNQIFEWLKLTPKFSFSLVMTCFPRGSECADTTAPLW